MTPLSAKLGPDAYRMAPKTRFEGKNQPYKRATADVNRLAYIDGFNLYNGALKGTPYKWLDLQAFSQSLRPTDTVSQVKFFTAKVNARPNDPDQPIRQMLYWRAVRTIGSVEIIEGHFLTKRTYLPEVASLDRGSSQDGHMGTKTPGSL